MVVKRDFNTSEEAKHASVGTGTEAQSGDRMKHENDK
jgi:hypothetical protein